MTHLNFARFGILARRTARLVVKVAAFGLAFVVNPTYLTGCNESPDTDEPDVHQIEQDLLADLDAVNETSKWTFTVAAGESYEVTLALVQSVGEDQMAEVRPTSALLGR